jgi:hypothetical protein
VSKRFRNYCGPIKVARSGFPWEKTTKGYVAGRSSDAGVFKVAITFSPFPQDRGSTHTSAVTFDGASALKARFKTEVPLFISQRSWGCAHQRANEIQRKAACFHCNLIRLLNPP